MKMNRIIIIAITLLSLFPTISRAQFGFDIPSVEAYIYDHKEQRSLLLVRSTETVSDRIGDYKDMLEDFNKKCLERGNIVSTDTLIITINARALAKIADEGDNLYKSVSDLVLYATGAAACSTSDLILVLSSINQSLDNIKKHLNKAYFDTWKYIQVRIGYWKRQVYRAKTKQEIIEGAFGRWKGAGYLGY